MYLVTLLKILNSEKNVMTVNFEVANGLKEDGEVLYGSSTLTEFEFRGCAAN